MINECPICLEEKTPAAALAPCGHCVCNSCWYDKYRVGKQTCPICGRRVLSEKALETWDWREFIRSERNPYRHNYSALESVIAYNVYPSGRKARRPQSLTFVSGDGPTFVIKGLDGNRFACSYHHGDVKTFKHVYARNFGYSADQLRFVYKGQPLWDDFPLDRIAEGDTVYQIMQMRGDIGHYSTSGVAPETCVDSSASVPPAVKIFTGFLSPEDCGTLRWLCPAKHGEREIPLDLIPTWLRERVRSVIDFDLVQTRTVTPGSGFIPFHFDVSRFTLQLFLNPPGDYIGGRVVYETCCPERPQGTAILHDHRVWHGVTTLTRGRRESIFFIQRGKIN